MIKKIAIFNLDLNIGGIQKSLLNLLKIIDYEKYKVDLYLFSKDNLYKDIIPKNVNVIYKKERKLIKYLPYFIYKKINKKNSIKIKYDISIDYNSYQNITSFMAINCFSSKKIMWIHSDLYKRYHYNYKYRIMFLLNKSKFKYFDTFVFVSNEAKKSFYKLYQLKGKRNYIIPNYIDTSNIIKLSKEECFLKINKNNYNLVTLGRLIYSKGFDILIKEMKKVVLKRKDIHLYIIGDGNMRNRLINLIKKNHLDNYITLVGGMCNPYKYMNMMDAFIFASRYEGQGISIMEAKVLGLKLIISKNLEKYVNITGYNDFFDILCKVKKTNKKYDILKEYNTNVRESINQVLNDR